jgi:glycosyltransferase involved in cell wall biosynthesis
MVAALRRRTQVEFLSWRRLYPPVLYRGEGVDVESRPPRLEHAEFLLDWLDPRTWRRALERVDEFGADAVVLPWLHPVSAPPYRWLLRRSRGRTRVVVCHNVELHERLPLARPLTRATLRHADLIVTHAPQMRGELAALGLGHVPVLDAFHPRFVAADLSAAPDPVAVAAERRRLGDPGLLLLAFGAVRPYKGVDVALEALAGVDPRLDARLVVAGKFWHGVREYEEAIERLGLRGRVELRDRFVPNEAAAVLFAACDAALLPYRSATQSGVAQLAFGHGVPVIATSVGGLPSAVRDGVDGILCPPEDACALARAIERFAHERAGLRAGVRAEAAAESFDRYAEFVLDAVANARR